MVLGNASGLRYEGVGYGDSYVVDPMGEMVVRELKTADRWETAAWTAQSWKSKITTGKGK